MKLPKLPDEPPVIVYWVDASTHTGWTARHDLVKNAGVSPVITIGWIVHEDDEQIILASSIGNAADTDDTDVNAITSIPTAWLLDDPQELDVG